jgi:outer membrane lipoprotein-sorting protein
VISPHRHYRSQVGAGAKFRLALLVAALVGIPRPSEGETSAKTSRKQPSAAEKGEPIPLASTEPKNVQELLSRLTNLQGFEAEFVERKQLALLKAPLETKGRLYYKKKAGLARKEELPEARLIRVTEETVTIIDREGKKVIQLSNHPEVAALAGSFLLVLAGDHDLLLKYYTLGYEPAGSKADHWSLVLRPRAAPLNQLIQSIEIVGSGPTVSALKVLETNGDSSVTMLTGVNPARVFSPEEIERLFGLAAG